MKLRAPEFKKKKKVTPTEQLSSILEKLLEKKIINQEQYSKLSRPLKKPMTQELLIDALVKVGAIDPELPLDESVDDFRDELGSLKSSELVGFSQDIRLDRKGLTSMTPIPAKAFPIPANVLFISMIGAAMFLVIVGPNWDSIMKGISKAGGAAGGGGGIGGMFGNILPHFIMGLFS